MSTIACLHPIEENEEEIVEVIMGLYLSGMWFGVATRTDIYIYIYKHEFNRYWIVCSKYDNLSKLNSQHNLGGGGPI